MGRLTPVCAVAGLAFTSAELAKATELVGAAELAGEAELAGAAHPHACPGMTGPELQRYHALHRAEDRADFLAAHLLVRRLAAESGSRNSDAEVSPSWLHLSLQYRCPDCHSDAHGAPSIRSRPVSLSHSRGIVAAIAGAERLGIDVERLDALAEADPAMWLAPAERGVRASDYPARAWTIKEALVKAGMLTLDAMTRFDAQSLLTAAGRGKSYRIDGQRWWAISRVEREVAVAAIASSRIRLEG